ncbi:MAG TPA: hypothetical protein VGY51_12565 [Acidimicrobiales bacterium]|nr:hypothetical protein [Acidimicrobiales bacterium]
MVTDEPQVIHLGLAQASEMFEMPQSDLFSEYRNFLTGVDYCVSELRSRRSRSVVRLEISLPPSEIEPGMADRISRTLGRYCDHKMSYNDREQVAVRYDGVSSLRVGLPIAALGFVIAVLGAKVLNPSTDSGLVLDTGGWVLAWVGLWYPLDTIFFTPLGYGRENRVLQLLHDAEVVVRPHT